MAQIPEYLLPEEPVVGTQPIVPVGPVAPIPAPVTEPVTAPASVDPNKKYQDIYNKVLKQEMMLMKGPGQPEDRDAYARQLATMVAKRAQDADYFEKQKLEDAQAKQYQKIDEENKTRAELGLPPLPGGTPAQTVQPIESNIIPANDTPINIPQNQPMIPQMPQAPSIYSGDKAIQDSYLAQQKALDDQAKAADTYMRDQQALMKAGIDKIKTAEDELAKVEIKDFWADRSTGAKIGAAIAMALGGFGAGISGGRNQAADIINSAIDRDLQIQKEKQAKLQGRLSNARTLLGDQQKMLGDTYAAELNVKNIGLQKAKLIADEALAKTNNQAKKLEMQKLGAEIGKAQAETQAALMERMALVQMSQGGDINPAMLAYAGKDARARFVNDPVFGGFVSTPEEKKSYMEKLETYNNSTKVINKLLKIADDPKAKISMELGAEAKILTSALKAAIRKGIVGEGAVSETEWKLLDDIAANPTLALSITSLQKKRLQTLQGYLRDGMTTAAKLQSITPKFNLNMQDTVLVKASGSKQAVRVPRADLPKYQQKYKNLEVVGE